MDPRQGFTQAEEIELASFRPIVHSSPLVLRASASGGPDSVQAAPLASSEHGSG